MYEDTKIRLDWTEKYRPITLAQITGNNKAIEDLKTWALSWLEDTPNERAVVLHGRAGIGKTTAAHALANDMGWEMVELNASDQRTADIINKVVGYASRNSTFDDIKRLVILDEADNIHGTADKGGEKAIVEIIKKTAQPIILIVNELYEMSSGLRISCKPIQFHSIAEVSMISALKRIADAEGIKCEQGSIEVLANFANGDMRSAINDLQAIGQEKSVLRKQDIIITERDIKEDNFKVVEKILKGNDIVDAQKSAFNLDEDPDSFIQWVDENMPLAFTGVDNLNEGYYYLSRAAIFLARVGRRQDYNMWKYANIMMTAGIVVSRSNNCRVGRFNYPSIRQRLKKTKSMRNIRDSVAKKIGAYCHISIGYTRSKLLPLFRIMMRDDSFAISISALLGFDLEEIAFLLESEVSEVENIKIQNIYNCAQSIIEGQPNIEKSKELELSELDNIYDDVDNEVKEVKKSQSSLFDF